MKIKLFAIATLSSIALSACATSFNSRFVAERENGGRLVYVGEPGSYGGDKGRADAESKMKQKCPAGYQIKEQGEQAGSTSVGGPMIQQRIPEKYIDFVCKA
jgi:hypothetical protein